MKEVLMILPHMVGGGAERVASLLVNSFVENEIKATMVLTEDRTEEVVRCDLKKEIPLILLQEEINDESVLDKIKYLPYKILSKVFCRILEQSNRPVPAQLAYISFIWQHHREIKYIRAMMKAKPDMTVISFLQPSIPITLLAARGLQNKVIISERCDPNRLMKKRYGRPFIEKFYERTDVAVFQTEDAMSVYPDSVKEKGTIIFNPIKDGLPKPYNGERNKYITTFCRISEQKNIPVLVDAFKMLHKEYQEYILKIVGDAPNEEGARVVESVKEKVHGYNLVDSVIWEPFSANVHEEILEDAMYVNTSNYEGISNAMLEAMAVGLPVICTDCPVGGANATIEDGVNGLLVPVGDADAVYRAMKKIVEDKEFAKSISKEAIKLKDRISLENISREWMELL